MAHIWNTGSYFVPLLYILCVLCDEVLLSCNCSSPMFDISATRTPQIWKKVYFFHILGVNLKFSYQIVSLFDMYIDMGERIAGKQDRPSLIIEDPPPGPLISPKYIYFFTFWLLYHDMKNWFSNCFPLLYICLHCDEGCICWQSDYWSPPPPPQAPK